MTTRFYLPGGTSGTTPAPPVSPAVGTMWEVTSANFVRSAWSTTPANTSLSSAATVAGTENASAAVHDVVCKQFVSTDTLPAKTIGGTASLVIRTLSTTGAGAADHYTQLRLAVISGDGATVRGELFSGQVATGVSAVTSDPNAEWASGAGAQRTRILSGLALTPVAASAGDRLLCEIGFRACNVVTTAYTGQLYFGDETATADYALAADLTTVLRPWLEFSENVFDPPPPAGGGTITWDQMTCLGPPSSFGRWADVPASSRWNTTPASVTWDTWT